MPALKEELDIRKSDHIRLAFESQVSVSEADSRFFYEPMLAPHPEESATLPVRLGNKEMQYPIWISSMTGGTEAAYTINQRLAEVCARYGLGMGLGSCRPLLHSRSRWADFNLRPVLGPDVPFFANLGIAQIERILQKSEWQIVEDLVSSLGADGLIIHVNPLQELMQPEGDRFGRRPLDVIQECLNHATFPIIVKEVGQGFGPASLEALLRLPLLAVDFGSFGGTNFTRLENHRNPDAEGLAPLALVGHSAVEMMAMLQKIYKKQAFPIQTRNIIVSGGIKNFLDGYFLISQSPLPAIYGQASAFLKYAAQDAKALDVFTKSQIKGLQTAFAFLKPKKLSDYS